MGVATHTGKIGMYPQVKDIEERIYSGKAKTTMLLTINLHSPPGSTWATVETLVNGHSFPDGTIKRKGYESRTFRLEDVNTIDLVLKESEGSQTGEYTISIPLPPAK